MIAVLECNEKAKITSFTCGVMRTREDVTNQGNQIR
jgi:hypothetical protein